MARPFKDLTSSYDAADAAESCYVAKTSAERRTLLNHAERDDLVSPYPHLYTRRVIWEKLHPDERALWMINGLAALHPRWLFCNGAAALIHKLWVPYSQTRTIDVCSRNDASAIQARQEANQAPRAYPSPAVRFVTPPSISRPSAHHHEPVRKNGVLVTPLDDTACDCLCAWDFKSGLMVADSYLSKTRQDRSSLLRLLEPYGGCKGSADARITASYADGRSESGGESFTRGRIIELGYAIPDLQIWFQSPLDGSHARADFVWTTEFGNLVIGEYDGLDKYEDLAMLHGRTTAETLVRQNLRDDALSLQGRVFHVAKWTVANTDAFCTLLDAYGVPRAPDAWITRAPAKNRIRRGLRASIIETDDAHLKCYVEDGPAMLRRR